MRSLAAVLASTLAAAVLVPLGTGLTTSAAQAATATTISGSDGAAWISRSSYASQPGAPAYGEKLNLSIKVYAGSDQVYDGTLTVERQLAGASTWTTVTSSDSAYLYDSVPAVANATYRVLYSGTADYEPSTSSIGVKVQRALDITGRTGKHASMKIKVKPAAVTKVTVLKKNGKKWKKFKTVTTNKSGVVTTVLPAPRKGKWFWRVTIPASTSFTTTQSNVYYTTKY